jgi:hypothetical protein
MTTGPPPKFHGARDILGVGGDAEDVIRRVACWCGGWQRNTTRATTCLVSRGVP